MCINVLPHDAFSLTALIINTMIINVIALYYYCQFMSLFLFLHIYSLAIEKNVRVRICPSIRPSTERGSLGECPRMHCWGDTPLDPPSSGEDPAWDSSCYKSATIAEYMVTIFTVCGFESCQG